MNEETSKKILYLILKITIQNSGFLSQLEIFRDVRFFMNKYFKIKESDLIVKVGQGKSEDFKDILNFILTILCELALVSQKMENKSFYFKWNGLKGFRKKYLLDYVSSKVSNFEMSESFEHRIQIYTRLLLLSLFEKGDSGVTYDQVEEIVKKCGLEGQNRHTDKIHTILRFIDFIVKEPNDQSTSEGSKHSHQIFTLVTKDQSLNSNLNVNRGDHVAFKIHKALLDENLQKDSTNADKYYLLFNENVLSKDSLWTDEILKNDKGEEEHINNEVKMEIDDQVGEGENVKINHNSVNSLGRVEINELDQYKVNINNFNSDNEEAGFALLRGNNWCYYIKKLYCIIGRAPIKYGVAITSMSKEMNMVTPTTNYGNTTWHVDVDLGQNRKISKQHALIAYNFQNCSFEIQNLSKKHPVKVNGEALRYGEEMPLSSKSLIVIGSEEFYFLLPL